MTTTRRTLRGALLAGLATAIAVVGPVATADAATPPEGGSAGLAVITNGGHYHSTVTPLDVPGLPAGAPKDLAVSYDGKQVAVVGSDDYLYYADLTAASPWFVKFYGPGGPPVLMTARSVAVDTDPRNGTLQLAVVATNGRLYHLAKPLGGAWSPWGEPSPAGATYQKISLSIDGLGNAHFAALDSASNAIYRRRYPGGSWSGWEGVPDVNGGAQKGIDVALSASRSGAGETRTFCGSVNPVTHYPIPPFSWGIDGAVHVVTLDQTGQLVTASKLLDRGFARVRSVLTNGAERNAPAGLRHVAIIQLESWSQPRSTIVASTVSGASYQWRSAAALESGFFLCPSQFLGGTSWYGETSNSDTEIASPAGSAGMAVYSGAPASDPSLVNPWPVRFLTTR